MSVYSYYPEHGRFLTTFGRDAKEGDEVTTSTGSSAYSLPRGAFGWRGCEFTSYVLPAPIGVNKRGEPLFDVEGIGVCPLDGSIQNEATREAAERRELDKLLNRL